MKNPFKHEANTGVSFLPEDYIARRAETRSNLIALGLFSVVMFGVVGAFFVTNRQWLSVHSEQEAVTAQYAAEAERIEQLKHLESRESDVHDKAEIITALSERVPRSILLGELITRMPENVNLLSLDVVSKRIEDKKKDDPKKKTAKKPNTRIRSLSDDAKDGADDEAPEKPGPPRYTATVELVGVATANNDIADYQHGLETCSLLSNVELAYIKDTVIDQVGFRKFRITAVIRQDIDARALERTTDPRLVRPDSNTETNDNAFSIVPDWLRPGSKED